MTEGPYKLPKGWRWVKLGEMCEHRTGVWGPEASSPARGFPIVRSTEIDGMFIRPETASVREVQKNRLNSYTLESGDILVNKSSGSSRLVGWPALFKDPKDGRMYLFSNFMLRLRPKRNILISHFLLYYLHSPIARSIYLGAQDTTSGLRNLRVRDFMNQPIPLPPLEEQRRIVARIEELMERIREARHLRQKAREDTERLWQATLFDVFPRPGTALPSGWRWVKLGEVCEINPRRPLLDVSPSEETTFVPMSAVDGESGMISMSETRPFEKVKTGYTYFEENDVLFAKITPCMENGKAAVARGLLNGFGFGSTEFHVLRPSCLVLSEWIWLFVRREDFRKSAEAMFRGGVGQQRVPAEFLKETPIPLPPLEEQRRIVAQLEEVEEKVKSLKEGQAHVEAELQRLEQSILNAAFRGEL